MPGAPFAMERVTLIYVPGAPLNKRNLGSGYFVDAKRILTAAHVVGAKGTPCRVKPHGGDYLDARVVWRGKGQDLALLELVADENAVEVWSAVDFGKVAGLERIPCRAVGFPDAQVHRSAGGRQQRDPEEIEGRIAPLTGDSARALTVHIEGSVPQEPGAKSTKWAGISGAALFAGRALVGVIAVDPAEFGENRLLAAPLAAVAGDEAFKDALAIAHPLELVTVQAPADRQSDITVISSLQRTAADTTSSEPAVATRVLHIGVLLSGDLPYTRAIHRSFEGTLETILSPRGFAASVVLHAGPSEPISRRAVREKWVDVIASLRDRISLAGRNDFDYYAGIGTQASVALAESGAGSPAGPPLLFLGVTDALAAGLIDNERGRDDIRQVAGVSYGGGPEDILMLVAKLFPGRRLAFFYQAGVPQDEAIAARLQQHRLRRSGVLRVLRCPRRPAVSDLRDLEAVYFSWYTFDRMLEDGSADAFVRDERLLVLTTTESNVEEGLSVASIAADDSEIGAAGAAILADHAAGGAPFGRRDVVRPGYKYAINLEVARRRGLVFSEEVQRDAVRIYGGKR